MEILRSKYFVFFGVFFASTSVVFIRNIDASFVTIAMYRLFAGALFMLVPFMCRISSGKSTISKRSIFTSVACGVFLAGHFITWIGSLAYTTISSSMVLVSLSPLFVSFFNCVFLKEKLKRIQAGGLVIAIIGAIIVSLGDISISAMALYGDFLALVGAVFLAGYLIIGKNISKTVAVTERVFITYLSAALVTLMIVKLSNIEMGFGTSGQLLMMLFHGVICSGIGHTIYNWMLQHTSSTYVSASALGEPVFGSILAWMVLGEILTFETLAGGIVLVVGLCIFIKSPEIKLFGISRVPVVRSGNK